MPATSNLLGKLRLAVQHGSGWVFPRDVLEALESIEEMPLPARCGFWAVPGGVAVEVVARDTPTVRHAIELSLQTRGLPVEELHLVGHQSELRCPIRLRGDLRELSFSQPVVGHSAVSVGEPSPPQLAVIGE
jgi:phenylacetate-CoA ligase